MDDNDPLGDEITHDMHAVLFGEFERLRTGTPAPSRLHHFSDCGGMVGVIERRTLWASLATCLNDASEVEYGLDIVYRLLESKLATKASAFLRHTKARLKDSKPQPYVACFCASESNAHHWMSYGRNGAGVALGFDGARLVQSDQLLLLPVSYDAKVLEDRADAMFAQFDQLIQKYRPDITAPSLIHLEKFAAKVAAVLLVGLACFVKHPSFSTEDEWRLAAVEVDAPWFPDVFPAAPAKSFRISTSGRIVPYRKVEYDAGKLPLVEIVLGSGATIRPGDRGLDVLLRQTFKPGPLPSVRTTNIPVR